MKNLSNFKKQAQRGFTLIEILVALAILSVIALLASNAFDGSRSKAQVMIGLAKQVGDANIMLKTDTGCFINRPSALFDPIEAAKTTNNYCARLFGQSWSGPYLGQYTLDGTSGSIAADKIASGILVSLTTEASGTGSGKRYIVKMTGVPIDILKQALRECNTSAVIDDKGVFPANRCRTVTDIATVTTVGEFETLYAVTF